MALFKPAHLLICLIPITTALGMSQSGCGGGREDAYGEIASIYAEVLIAQLMYGAVLVLAQGKSWHETGVIESETLLVEFMMGTLGYAVAIAWQLNPWLIIPSMIPLVVVFRAMMVPQLQHEAEVSRLKSAQKHSSKRMSQPSPVNM